MAKNTWYTKTSVRKIKLKGGGSTTKVIKGHVTRRKPK